MILYINPLLFSGLIYNLFHTSTASCFRTYFSGSFAQMQSTSRVGVGTW